METTTAVNSLRLIGYCSLDKDAILDKYYKEGVKGLTELKGEYAITIDSDNETYIITSPYGVCLYYYALHDGKLYHDDTVLGVLRKSRLPYSWNWRALADFCLLEHVLEDDTLHPKVQRMPAASVLHYKEGFLKISTTAWEDLHPSSPTTPENALDAFNDEVKLWMGENNIVPLTGGLDCRVVLSTLMKENIKPVTFTAGFEDTTDVVIAKEIADGLGLDWFRVNLDLEDYLNYGELITALTNGTKKAWHWHTYIFSKKANLNPNWPCFTGTNSEFVRTYVIDRGLIAMAADMLPSLSLPFFWKRLIGKTADNPLFKEEELTHVHKELAKEFSEESQNNRVNRLVKLCYNEFLTGLDRFCIEQTTRNFYGTGVKLWQANLALRAAFLGHDWVKHIWNLGRYWKLGLNWHRFAIEKNYPQLLDFPSAGSILDYQETKKTASRAPFSYWIPTKKKYQITGYGKYEQRFREDVISDFIVANASLLADIVREKTIKEIVEENKKEGNRINTIAFLLTMVFWMKNVKKLYEEIKQPYKPVLRLSTAEKTDAKPENK